jgi:hypothetical protein
MGGARNEAIGLIVVLIILTLIAVAFFWQAARKGSIGSPSAGAPEGDDTALQFDDHALPHAGSFSSVRDSWNPTDLRSLRERPVERVALLVLENSNRAM